MKIFDAFRRELQVIRETEGSYINGYFVAGDLEFITIRGSIDPTPAEVMSNLPEGYRTRDSYTIYTDTMLRTSVKNKTNPDIVIIDDEKYIVIKVAHWGNTILKHYEVIVVKEDLDAD